jgi:hypothetical protein
VLTITAKRSGDRVKTRIGGIELKQASVIAEDIDGHPEPRGWKALGNSFAPFNKCDIAGFEVFLDAKFKEFIIVMDAVGIDMGERSAALVASAEDKCGADNQVDWDPAADGEGLGEPGFAGAESAVQ